MPRKAMEILTETMFYVLMALQQVPMCGIDIAAAIEDRTQGRLLIGPACASACGTLKERTCDET